MAIAAIPLGRGFRPADPRNFDDRQRIRREAWNADDLRMAPVQVRRRSFKPLVRQRDTSERLVNAWLVNAMWDAARRLPEWVLDPAA